MHGKEKIIKESDDKWEEKSKYLERVVKRKKCIQNKERKKSIKSEDWELKINVYRSAKEIRREEEREHRT